MTQALAVSTKDMGIQVRRVVDERKDMVFRMLPANVDKERFWEVVLSVVSTPEIASCTPKSIISCAFACAKVGLMPDPILNLIHIIPRNLTIGRGDNAYKEMTATILVGYKGFIELARRSGGVRMVHTEVAYTGDKFRYWIDEHGPHITHEPNLEREAEETPTCAYCVAEMTGGGHPQITVVPWYKVLQVRADTPAWNDNNLVEMGKKTAIRRASKLWPQSPEMANVVRWDEQLEEGERQSLPSDEMPSVLNGHTNGNSKRKPSLSHIQAPSPPVSASAPSNAPTAQHTGAAAGNVPATDDAAPTNPSFLPTKGGAGTNNAAPSIGGKCPTCGGFVADGTLCANCGPTPPAKKVGRPKAAGASVPVPPTPAAQGPSNEPVPAVDDLPPESPEDQVTRIADEGDIRTLREELKASRISSKLQVSDAAKSACTFYNIVSVNDAEDALVRNAWRAFKLRLLEAQ